MKEFKGSEKGAVFVFVAFILFAIVAFLALSYEAGRIYHTKNQLQAAVDAAALSGVAGVQFFRQTGDTSKVQMLAEAFSETALAGGNAIWGEAPAIDFANNVELINYDRPSGNITVFGVDFTNRTDVNGVRVRSDYNVGHSFSRFLGGALGGNGPNNTNVPAAAIAVHDGPECVQLDLPITLVSCCLAGDPTQCNTIGGPCEFGTCNNAFVFTSGFPQNGQFAPSTQDNIAWFTVPPDTNVNASTIGTLIGRQQLLCAGTPINVTNGVQAVNIQRLETWIQSLGLPTPPLNVPVIDCKVLDSTGQQNPVQSAPVLAIARVRITGIRVQGGNSEINFSFACNGVFPNTVSGGTNTCGGAIAQYPALVR